MYAYIIITIVSMHTISYMHMRYNLIDLSALFRNFTALMRVDRVFSIKCIEAKCRLTHVLSLLVVKVLAYFVCRRKLVKVLKLEKAKAALVRTISHRISVVGPLTAFPRMCLMCCDSRKD